LVIAVFAYFNSPKVVLSDRPAHFWQMQSIDTVKFSRDTAGQYADDASFDEVIDKQVGAIAGTGATHIAISTPYDEQFVPFLRRWVVAARKYNLKVWFRGNFSGWEGWFGYKSITREEHQQLLRQFITDNGSLFADGDVFSACTECENGGPGDPRRTGDVEGFRQFMIDEYKISKEAFRLTGKNVACNYFPMNYDIATLVMDKPTTMALGGLVVIDHYVPTAEILDSTIDQLAQKTGGKIVVGEFGAPIPDIHGDLTEAAQAGWIQSALTKLVDNSNVVGVNYWTGFGGSTKLWNDDGSPRQAVAMVSKFYKAPTIKGYVVDEIGRPIDKVLVSDGERTSLSGKNGDFYLPTLTSSLNLTASKDGYQTAQIDNQSLDNVVKIVLQNTSPGMLFRLQKFFGFLHF
jgi:hypothetical protein